MEQTFEQFIDENNLTPTTHTPEKTNWGMIMGGLLLTGTLLAGVAITMVGLFTNFDPTIAAGLTETFKYIIGA